MGDQDRKMQLKVGEIVEGTVKSLTKFGAFVALDANTTGLVHISEVAHAYVSDLHEYLTEGQTVKVMQHPGQSIHHYRYPEATGNIPKPLYTLSYPHTDKNTIFFSFSCPFASTICTQITGNGVQEAAYAKVPP